MAYVAGDTITGDQYNIFVNNSSSPYGYNHFAGTGSGEYGLGRYGSNGRRLAAGRNLCLDLRQHHLPSLCDGHAEHELHAHSFPPSHFFAQRICPPLGLFGRGSPYVRIYPRFHQRGVGVCGIYAYDLAETKAMQVMNYARKYEHPLQVQLEKE